MMKVAFEVDFLAVGTGEKSGDAIIVRYALQVDLSGKLINPKIIVIDGGTLDSGSKIVEHIQQRYGTNVVNLIISTHPDNDHCSGLREVLDKLVVEELWLHRPWNYPSEFIETFQDGKLTNTKLKKVLKEALETTHEIETIAKAKKIKIVDPYEGLEYDNGVIKVLGPSENFYKQLLANFRETPVAKESVVMQLASGAKSVVNWIKETLTFESLDESGITSAENNSSVITLFTIGSEKLLFTGDAGIPALKNVIKYAASMGISLKDLRFIQVPHHGSKRNVSPSVLNNMMGKTAYVSAADDSPKHPAKKVVNAFKRRGAKVFATQGQNKWHNCNVPGRQDYSSAQELPFYNEVEE